MKTVGLALILVLLTTYAVFGLVSWETALVLGTGIIVGVGIIHKLAGRHAQTNGTDRINPYWALRRDRPDDPA